MIGEIKGGGKMRRAQSTVEYVIVFSAIITALIVAAKSYIQPQVKSSIEHVANEMYEGVRKIDFGGAAQQGQQGSTASTTSTSSTGSTGTTGSTGS
jgi:hypothetical protein